MVIRSTLLALSVFVSFAASVQDPPPKLDPPAAPRPSSEATERATAPNAEMAAQLAKLSWLSGTWSSTVDGVTTEEHWRPLQGSTQLGTSHTFDDRRTFTFEYLRITATRDGVAYVAAPRGGRATTFLLAQNEDGVAVFENGKHDHPQRIRYERTAAGVTATISMLDGSRAESFVFTKK